MALWTQGKGQVLGRRDSLRGVSYSYVRRGVEVTAKWPRKRGDNLHPKTLAQMEYFRQVQWAWKYSAAGVQRSFADAVKGTPLMPRDIFLMWQAGRAVSVTLPDGRTIYHMATINAVSDSLDVFTKEVGAMLYRGAQGWRATGVPATPGQVLVSQPAGEPLWQDLGGAGAFQKIEQFTLAANAATIDFDNIPVTFRALELHLYAKGTAAAASDVLKVTFNGDNGAHYDYQRWNRFGSGLAVAATYIEAGVIVAATPASRASTTIIRLPGYGSLAFFKSMSGENAYSGGTGTGDQISASLQGEWRSTAQIDRITLALAAGQFATGTEATLYGIG